VAALAAASGALLLSQTAAGRALVTGLVADALRGTIDGRVIVGPVTGGNLVTRATLDRFAITDTAGEVFVDLRDVRVEYNPIGFLIGRYRFRNLDVGEMEVALREEPDGRWNFERIFGDDSADEDAGGGVSIALTDVSVEEGRLEVRTPWDGEAPTDEGPVWRIERTEDGGMERVITLEELRGRMPALRVADPTHPFHVQLQGIEGLARAVRQPLRIERMDAEAVFGDTVRVDLPDVRTTESRLEGDGWVVPGDPLAYRFDLRADPMSFSELQWLPVPVPGTGGGPADLVLRSDGGPLTVEVDDASVQSEDSRLRGSFVVTLTDPARFEALDVELDPARLALVDRLLDRETLIDGFLTGRVGGSGPLDLLEIDADVQLRSLPGDTAVPPASDLTARGGVGLFAPRSYGDLRLELSDFEPRWTRLLGIETRQSGRLDGTLTLNGSAGDPLAFEVDLRHRLPGDTTSRVTGSGSVPLDSAARLERGMDVRLVTDPLSLTVLDPYFPALEMTGVVRGPVQASGTLGDLTASADLTTPRGRLEFDGRFDLAAERRTYDARLTASDIQLRQWFEGGPPSRLEVRGSVIGEGTDPEDLTATFDLQVLPSEIAEATVDTSLLRFTVDEGLARADTFIVNSDAGTVRGQGTFGLAPDRSGPLTLEVDAPDLSTWNRWIVPGRGSPADTTSDMFAEFEGAAPGGPEPGEVVRDTLAGSLTARGVAYGSVDDFAFGGLVRASAPSFGPLSADSLRVTVDVTDARSMDSLVVQGTSWRPRRAELTADSATARFVRLDEGSGELRVHARRDTSAGLDAEADVEWGGDTDRLDLGRLDLQLGAQRLSLDGPARLERGEAGVTVDGLALIGDPGGRVTADGVLPRDGDADFQFDLERVELADVGAFLDLDARIAGRADASLRVRGTASSPTMEGDFGIRTPGFEGLDYGLLTGDLAYADRRMDGTLELASGERTLASAEGGVRVDLSLREVDRRLLDDPLDLRLRSDSLPLGFLEIPFEALREVTGRARGELSVAGAPDALNLDGDVEIREAAATLPALGVRFSEVGGGVRFQGSEARLDSMRIASSAGGSALISGTVGLATPSNPAFDLELTARRLRGINRRRATLVLDGAGELGGDYLDPILTGTFRATNGTVRYREFQRGDQVVDLSDPELYALVDTTTLAEQRVLARAQDPFMQNLRTDVTVRVGPDLWFRSTNLAVELEGEVDVRMDRAQGDLAVFGDLQLVRGNYLFTRGPLSRQLRITGGTLEFVGTPGMNPNLDVTAEHRTRTAEGPLEVRTQITGTMLSPTLAFTSDPPLSQSDQVCVL
ncbi:MAG: translocation/assembly module TamB domain-containing protein, partial [Gemmatimonadota bacterium]